MRHSQASFKNGVNFLTADESMSSLLVHSGFYQHSIGVIRFQILSVPKRESSRQVLPPSLLFNGQHFYMFQHIFHGCLYIFTYFGICLAIGICFISVSINQIHVHHDHNKHGQVRSALPV